jgi:hypothetical protein
MAVEERLERLERLVMGQREQEDTVAEEVRARAFHVFSMGGKTLIKSADTHGLNKGQFGTLATFNSGGGQELVRLGTSKSGAASVQAFFGLNENVKKL